MTAGKTALIAKVSIDGRSLKRLQACLRISDIDIFAISKRIPSPLNWGFFLPKGVIMEQILLHLIGDYITQTEWMANNKIKRHAPAAIHAVVYSIPFLMLTQSSLAILVIAVSHFFIDRYRLARYVIFAKNWITNRKTRWCDCLKTGYAKDTPDWLAFWLMIIADNTIHMTINYIAIRWA